MYISFLVYEKKEVDFMTCYNSIYGITKVSTLLNEYVMSFMHRHVSGNWNAAVIYRDAFERNPSDAGSRKMQKYT